MAIYLSADGHHKVTTYYAVSLPNQRERETNTLGMHKCTEASSKVLSRRRTRLVRPQPRGVNPARNRELIVRQRGATIVKLDNVVVPHPGCSCGLWVI